MSDVPELDRMLDEHHVFKSNISWERSEKFQVALLRLFLLLLALLVFLYSLHFFGFFVLFVLVFLPHLCQFIRIVVPDPSKRDPFVRYKKR